MLRYGITIDELLERFDDDHLDHLYALSLLDEDGEESRRAARVCATIHNGLANVMRSNGAKIPDSHYRTPEDFMNRYSPPKKTVQYQPWSDARKGLGFE